MPPTSVEDMIKMNEMAAKVAMESPTFIQVQLAANPLMTTIKNIWEVIDALAKDVKTAQESLAEAKSFLPMIPKLEAMINEARRSIAATSDKVNWGEKFKTVEVKIEILQHMKDKADPKALLELREIRKSYRDIKELSRWPGDMWKSALDQLNVRVDQTYSEHDRHATVLGNRARKLQEKLQKSDALEEIKEESLARLAKLLDSLNMLSQMGNKNKTLYNGDAEIDTEEMRGDFLKELINYYDDYYNFSLNLLPGKGFVLNEEFKAATRDMEKLLGNIDSAAYQDISTADLHDAIAKIKAIYGRSHANLVHNVWSELDDIEADSGEIKNKKDGPDPIQSIKGTLVDMDERLGAIEMNMGSKIETATEQTQKIQLDVNNLYDGLTKVEESLQDMTDRLPEIISGVAKTPPWGSEDGGLPGPNARSNSRPLGAPPGGAPTGPGPREISRSSSRPVKAGGAPAAAVEEFKEDGTRNPEWDAVVKGSGKPAAGAPPSSVRAASKGSATGGGPVAASAQGSSTGASPGVQIAYTGSDVDIQAIHRKLDDLWGVLADKADKRLLEDVERSLHGRFEELMYSALQTKVDREALEMIHKQLQDMIDGKADATTIPILLREKVDKATLENMQQHIMTKMELLDKTLRNEVSNQLEMKIDTFEKGLEDRLAYLQDMISKQDEADFDEERFRKELEDNKADLAELALLINQKVDMDALSKAMKDKSVDLEAKADLSYTEELFNRFSKAVEALSSQIDKSKTEKGHVQAIDLGLQLLRLQLSEKADRDDVRKIQTMGGAPGSPTRGGGKGGAESAALLGRGIFHCLSCDKEVDKVRTKPTSISSYSLPVTVRPRTAYDFRRNDPVPHTTSQLAVGSPTKDATMNSILEEKSIPSSNVGAPKRSGSPVKIAREATKPTVLFGSDGQIYRGRKSKIPPINHTQTTLPIRS